MTTENNKKVLKGGVLFPSLSNGENNKKRYYTVKQLVEREEFDAFSEASIRWYIFEDTNNFNKCILRINRKLLIDLEEFRAWIASHKQGGKNDR